MLLPPWLRKAVLAVHLVASVGWVGAVVAYLPLDLAVAMSRDVDVVRGAWVGMDMIASLALVPMAIGSLLSGISISLGTKWGLFRHWWVSISLALTAVATGVLAVEVGVIARAAEHARDPMTSSAEVLAIPSTLPHSVGGLLVLLVIHVLNVYKPAGLTRYGWRKQRDERTAAAARGSDRLPQRSSPAA
jgi:hypothetical protein